MLHVWVHGCDPGRVSDGSRLALCQILSIECLSSIFFWHVYFVIIVPFSLSFLFLFVCVFILLSLELFVDVPLIFFCPADHVPDWQPRILLGMVEALSVNVKKTTISIATWSTPSEPPHKKPFLEVYSCLLWFLALILAGCCCCQLLYFEFGVLISLVVPLLHFPPQRP